jgi:polyvinyl alcohol dehydrogenase (cytochrome)
VGSAADERFGYFPVARAMGLTAVDLATGEIAWRADPAERGAAPVTLMPGVAFFGASSGMFYAYSTTDGKALWQFDTNREFESVNGAEARGATCATVVLRPPATSS